mgnify:CR=1 FL=1
MGLKINDSEVVSSQNLNTGTTIMFDDGRELRLCTNEELIELINVLNYILQNGNLL